VAKLPYLPFFPADWLVDTRKLSIEARGAWIDILAYAWNEPVRGTYKRSMGMMAQELGVTPDHLKSILAELEWVAEFEVDENSIVTLLSRRMSRDEKKREYERKKKKLQRAKEDVPAMSPKSPLVVPQEKSEVRSQMTEVTKVKGERRTAPPFKKPTIEEIAAYAKSEDLRMDAQHFFDYYESNGWRVSRNPMKDWKATARNWARRDQHGTGTYGRKQNQFTDPEDAGKYAGVAK
jgi:uncharacterized protein YdaU (DUF1376 family)